MRHLLFSALAAGFFLGPNSLVYGQEDARAIIAKAIRARGGEDSYLRTGATRQKSKGQVHLQGVTYLADYVVQLPGQMRMEMEIDFQGQKFKLAAAVDGDKGWMTLEGQLQDLPPDSVATYKRALYDAHVRNLTPLLKEEGFRLSALGESKVQGQAAVGVKVGCQGQKDLSLYFDKQSGLLLKSEGKVKDEMSGREVLEEVYYSDYRELDPLTGEKQALHTAKLSAEGPALLDFIRTQTLTDADRDKLKALVRQLGDNSFQVREKASAGLVARGGAACPLLRQAAKGSELEIAHRAEECLKAIEAGTGSAAVVAALRLLAVRKPAGTAEVLLAYLTSAPDENTAREVRAALADVAVRDGKPDPLLLRALEDKDPVRRAAATEALGRDGKSAQERPVRKFFPTGLKLPMKMITNRGGKKYGEAEILDMQFFNRFEAHEFAPPK